MMRQCLLVVLLAVGSLCQQSFTAKVTITSKPGVIGILNGAISYNAPLGKMRINYAVGPIEYFDYTAKLRFLTCGTTCDTQTYTAPMPILYGEASDSLAGTDARGCTIRNKNGASGVASISVDGAGNTCSARFNDGTVFTFTAPGAGEAATALTPPASCPKPLCTKKIDFALIFDESGSISGPDFQKEKQFGESIANSFTWGPDYVQMSLVQFSESARLTRSITNSLSTFVQSMRGATQAKGATCIGCGIDVAWADVSSRGRPTATKVFIVLTDGENNRGQLTTSLTNAKNRGVFLFAIGVGNVKVAEINEIASTISGVKTAFFGDTFSDLPNILNGLVQATCVDIPGNPCGAGCQGFCSCGGVCVCPDTCDDGNKCTTDSCRPGANGNGCIYAPINCDDGNACTADSCNPATGCVHTPITCNDNSVCTIDSCIPSSGCSYQSIVCDDKSPCTTDFCTATGGCQATPIPNCPQVCSDPTKPITCPKLPCMINECDPNKGGACTATPKPCDDGNLCTVNSCNPANDTCYFTPINCDDKNACTTDYCDRATGKCVNLPFNATAVCNDYNACTDDICDIATGCKNVKKTCGDADVCTDDLCNSLTGCSNPPTDCWKTDPQLSQHPDLIGCVTATCEGPTKGCILNPINNTKIDQCGVCNGDDSTCDLNINSDTAVALGAGAIAGIVIGAVAIAGVAGVLGGKKGYDVWLKKRGNMQGANTNPMYTDNGLSGSNPMYNGDA